MSEPEETNEARVRAWLNDRAVALTLLAAALTVRLIDLNRFVTWDELFWTHASLRFWRAVEAGRWARTYVIHQPAVVSLWLGSLDLSIRGWLGGEEAHEAIRAAGRPRYNGDDLGTLNTLAQQWMGLPAVTGIVTAVAVVGVFFLTRRLFGRAAGIVGAALLAIDPFFLAHSRVLALDAVLASLMTVSLLLFLIYLYADGRTRFLVLSGVMGGLATLQKTTGIYLLGFVGLMGLPSMIAMVRRGQYAVALRVTVWPVALWALAAAATYVALWPAMWAAPMETLTALARALGGYVPDAHYASFFLGEATLRPNALFYPVVTLFRVMPLTILGLLLLGWRWVRRDPDVAWAPIGAILLYSVLFGVALTQSAAKFDRYLLPGLTPLIVAAAVGLVVGLRGVGRWRPLALTALVAAQTVAVLIHHPYYLSWYNPLLGGQAAAVRALPIGWGEGMEGAAHYLAAQPDAPNLTVAAWGAVGLAPWFTGNVVPPERKRRWREADYAVVYITDEQRDEEIAQAVRDRSPVFRGRVGHLDYVRVYRLRE